MRFGRRFRAATAAVLILVLGMAAATVLGCGGSTDTENGILALKEADNGKSFTVKVGDTIQVVIPGNPTTGYSWAAVLDDESAGFLAQQGEPSYVQETTDSQIVGAGGTYTFTFAAVAKGKATLKLAYSRPWESVPPEQTFEATITVK